MTTTTVIEDASGYRGEAQELLTPASEHELVDIVKRGLPVTIVGAGTGVTGGSVPQGGLAVSMAKFQKIEIEGGHARVGAGVSLEALGAATARKGLFYAQSRDGGKTFSEPMPIGEPGKAPSRPYVISGAEATAIVWKEFDGEKTSVNLITSADAGKTWSPPHVIATTSDSSDHPLLVAKGRRYYLSWMTKAEGYRLLPIEGEP